jgi:aminoglycoside phosphotransferase (APT) family kinase protein
MVPAASGESQSADPPGLDLQRLAGFVEVTCPGLASGPLQAEVIAGGKSNITYSVTDGVSTWVVRRPPLGHVLATAHDMGREYRVMSALQGTGVPVPRMIARCDDASLMGEPFYLMEYVTGRAYRQAADLAVLGPDRTRRIAERMVDVLLDLHAVDPASVGLEDFGRPAGFLERQVRRWKQQLDASATRDLPRAHELADLLAASVPADATPAIVHGDYRLDNLLIDPSDEVVAVVDWEMATIGDPLTDVALMYVYIALARIDTGIADAMGAPGFLTQDQVLARYVQASPRDTSRMGFYLGLAFFKLAVIVEGIHRRFVDGKTVGDGFGNVGDLVAPLVEQGIAALREDG